MHVSITLSLIVFSSVMGLRKAASFKDGVEPNLMKGCVSTECLSHLALSCCLAFTFFLIPRPTLSTNKVSQPQASYPYYHLTHFFLGRFLR